jgi:hypothetical protein
VPPEAQPLFEALTGFTWLEPADGSDFSAVVAAAPRTQGSSRVGLQPPVEASVGAAITPEKP